MKAAMEAKRPGDRTDQDIDNYNKAVNEFNKAVDKLNKDQNELNKKRDEALNKWNNMSEEFLHKHVPKYNG
jgi:flagellar biosynthesis chaperone FliJ